LRNRETPASAFFPAWGEAALFGQFPTQAAALVYGILLPSAPKIRLNINITNIPNANAASIDAE